MKKSISSIVFDVFNAIFLAVFAFVCLFPYWNIVATSLVGANEFYNKAIILIPESPRFDAYLFVVASDWVLNGLKMSVAITVISTLWQLFLIITVAYGLTEEKLPGRKFFNYFFIIPSYIVGGLIPYYFVVARFLNLGDTIIAVTMCMSANAFSWIVFRTFFKEIPKSLLESARIDGAGEFKILYNVILPLSKPAVATVALFIAVGAWNDWFRPMIFFTDDNNYPLPLILRRLVLEQSNSGGRGGAGPRIEEARKKINQRYGIDSSRIFVEALKASVIVAATLPVILVYPFLQKYFARGVMVGSVKA